jgi:hypothetical protein
VCLKISANLEKYSRPSTEIEIRCLLNLLAEMNMYLDALQIKKLLFDAEGVVCRLTMELAMRAKLQDPFESNKITLH